MRYVLIRHILRLTDCSRKNTGTHCRVTAANRALTDICFAYIGSNDMSLTTKHNASFVCIAFVLCIAMSASHSHCLLSHYNGSFI